MKKTVSGLAAAAALTLGVMSAGGTAVADAGDYGPTQASVNKTIDNIRDSINTDDLTKKKAQKLINKLRDAKEAGIIGQAKFNKFKNKIKNALDD